MWQVRCKFPPNATVSGRARVKIEKNTLSLPTPRGVRLVALGFLDDAGSAGGTLGATPNPESLHDFRVALRRLRSWLRAFKDDLNGTIKRKDRRALRDIAAATNMGRDLDVQLSWLRDAAKGWSRKRKKGANWLAQHLAARKREAGDPVDAALIKKFEAVQAGLSDRLSSYRAPVRRKAKAPALAVAIASRLMPHSDALGEALDEVRTVNDETAAHEARIAAKRLRYLLEPAAPLIKKGDEILVHLKSLQDELGALHDAHIIGHVLRQALEESAVADASRISSRALGRQESTTDEPYAPRDALIAVAERVREDSHRAFARVQKDWLRGRYPRFSREVTSFAKKLTALHD